MSRPPPEPTVPVIRPAGRADLPIIARLAEVIWRVHYPGIISEIQIDYMLARMYDLGRLGRDLEQGVRYDLILLDGRPVGFAGYGPESGEMKLHKLYVLPDHQRQGLGSRLLRHIEEQARRAGLTALVLTVNKANANAIAAYLKNGFTVRDVVVVDIGSGFVMDDYMMAKPLGL